MSRRNSRAQFLDHPKIPGIRLVWKRRGGDDPIYECEIDLGEHGKPIRTTGETSASDAWIAALEIRAAILAQIAQPGGSARGRRGRVAKPEPAKPVEPVEPTKPAGPQFLAAAKKRIDALLGLQAKELAKLREAGEPQHVLRQKSIKYRSKFSCIRKYLIPALGDKTFSEITKADLAAILEGATGLKTKSSVNNLSTVFNSMMQILADDSGTEATWPKISLDGYDEDENRGTFTEDEVQDILSVMTDEWIEGGDSARIRQHRRLTRAYVKVAVTTGARVGLEISRMKFRDFDTVKSDVPFRVAIIYKNAGKTHETREAFINDGERSCTFDDAMADIVQVQGKLRPTTELFRLPIDGTTPDYNLAINDIIQERKLGIEPGSGKTRTAYSLRHYYANTMITNGADINLLADAMGNSLAIMKKYYLMRINRKAMQRLVYTTPMTVLAARLARNPTPPDERMTDEDANADPDISDELAHGRRAETVETRTARIIERMLRAVPTLTDDAVVALIAATEDREAP